MRRRSSQTAYPLMSGSIKSRMTASGLSARASWTPSFPFPAEMTAKPSNSRASRSPITMWGSSSMMRIVFFGFAIGYRWQFTRSVAARVGGGAAGRVARGAARGELLDALEAEACAGEARRTAREDERLRATRRRELLRGQVVLDVAPLEVGRVGAGVTPRDVDLGRRTQTSSAERSTPPSATLPDSAFCCCLKVAMISAYFGSGAIPRSAQCWPEVAESCTRTRHGTSGGVGVIASSAGVRSTCGRHCVVSAFFRRSTRTATAGL